jgi:hypothetical protein
LAELLAELERRGQFAARVGSLEPPSDVLVRLA